MCSAYSTGLPLAETRSTVTESGEMSAASSAANSASEKERGEPSEDMVVAVEGENVVLAVEGVGDVMPSVTVDFFISFDGLTVRRHVQFNPLNHA